MKNGGRLKINSFYRLILDKRKGRGFTLIELFLVVAVLMVLMSLLQPSLMGVIERGHDIDCRNNLKELGGLAYIYGGDHDDHIPGNGMSFNGLEKPYYWQSYWGEYVPYTGAPPLNAADHSFWFLKGYLGQYLFDEGYNGSWGDHELYACESSTIRTKPDGSDVDFLFSYWVNVNSANGKEAPWADNRDRSDVRPLRWTRFIEIDHPSELMSIADVSQNQYGGVDASGAFNVDPHYYDAPNDPDFNTDPPPPTPGVAPHRPEELIGPMFPSQQGDVPSRRGTFDFRHSQGMNVVFIDGHVSNIFNGELKNKNIYRP
jgi:prepilin-type processing-associated H-X9-DG protein